MKSEEKSFERPPDAAEEHGLSFFTPDSFLLAPTLLRVDHFEVVVEVEDVFSLCSPCRDKS